MKKIFLSMMLSCFVAVMAMGVATTARADILEDIAAAMTAHPNGGSAMAGVIADLVVNAEDPAATAQAIVNALVAAGANAAQLSAAGTGIGQAANIAGLQDPALFARIAGVVAGATNEVQVAFDIATGTPTGAIDPIRGLLVRGPGAGIGTISEN